MNSEDFNNTICRICMDGNVILDWSNVLVEHGDITYKDCYYKYTQLMSLETDTFSTMLCQNCSDGLENMHSLILQALDSYKFLLDVNCIDSAMDVEDPNSCSIDYAYEDEDDTIIKEDISYTSTDFETVLFEKTDTESVDYFEYETNNELVKNISPVKIKVVDTSKTSKSSTKEMSKQKSLKIETNNDEFDNDQSLHSIQASKRIGKTNRESLNEASPRNKQQRKFSQMDVKNGDSGTQKKPRKKKKCNSQNTPSMCSICSKILHNKYSLRKHEKTHDEYRERKASCPICGVKFFEESYVKSHMHIHNENRVKKHKCEFCEKDFFEKGALNVHRRIHLGQMIPCSLCSKEFFRQVDLDIHMNSHSAAVINGNIKKRSRYWVQCKYCDKNILSTSYKAHTAAHLNEPLMKCSICDKGFFRRDCCTQHLKSIHKKTTDELNDYIITFNKNRLSHLLLEQTANIIPNVDE